MTAPPAPEPIAAPAGLDSISRGARAPGRGFGIRLLSVLVLLILGIFFLFPVLWMLLTSIKQQSDIFQLIPRFYGFPLDLGNYAEVFAVRGRTNLGSQFLNSIIVTVSATVLATVVGVPAAWAYSRMAMRLKKDQLFFILSTRFMPPVVVVIPLFVFFRATGLHDTLLGLILLYTAFNLPFTIWMMKGFVDEIPSEYEAAAMVDGYSRVQAFTRVSLPLLVPGILATAVFSLIFTWNEFVFAVFLTQDDARTVPPALASQFGGQATQWGPVAASAIMFAIPVLIFGILVRNYLVAGMTFGAVRR
jgi:multiple sugar transport system permease protein